MNGTLAAGGVEAAAARLAVDGDMLPLCLQPEHQHLRPGPEHRAERFRVERSEHREEDVLGRRTMRHPEHPLEPVGIGLPPCLHRLGVVAAADHGHQRDDHHRPQRIPLSLGTPRVRKLTQHLLEEPQRGLLVLF
jgi:hypothetical protein